MNKKVHKNLKFDDLYQVLLQESSAYDSLTGLLEKKQKAIIVGDIDAIQDLTAKEQSVIKQANAFSTTRLFVLKELQAKLNKKSGNVSLSNLLEISGKSEETQWIGIKQKLNNAVENIRKLNFENQELLKTSLAFVKEMVKVFFQNKEVGNGTYSEKGKVIPDSKSQKVLDCQI